MNGVLRLKVLIDDIEYVPSKEYDKLIFNKKGDLDDYLIEELEIKLKALELIRTYRRTRIEGYLSERTKWINMDGVSISKNINSIVS